MPFQRAAPASVSGRPWLPGRRGGRATALACAVLLLTACSPSSPQQFLPEPAKLQSAVDCSTATGWEPVSTAPASVLKGSIPDGFVTVEVVRCTPDPVTQAVTEDHLAGNYAQLLAALAEPTERGPGNCADYGEILPAIWLVNAQGQAVNIQWPMDSCSHSKPATFTALSALTVAKSRSVPMQEPVP